MVIAIWAILMLVMIIICGELRYRFLDRKETLIKNKYMSRTWRENVNIDINRLSMEQTEDDFVSSRVLAMRGSWRLAQNQVMGLKSFNDLKREEYKKKL